MTADAVSNGRRPAARTETPEAPKPRVDIRPLAGVAWVHNSTTCYEYSDWAWKARVAELAKKEREVESQRPARTERQPERAAETPPKERDTVPA